MGYRICPACGSRYFRAQHHSTRAVFHVSDTDAVIPLTGTTVDDSQPIDTEDICCGACSWRGRLKDLQLSDLY